jgi:cardiolipin synthase
VLKCFISRSASAIKHSEKSVCFGTDSIRLNLKRDLKMKKGNKRVAKSGLTRMIIICFIVLLEVMLLAYLVTIFNQIAVWMPLCYSLIAGFAVIFLYSSYRTSAVKVPWIILILAFPVVGVIAYFIIGFNQPTKNMRKKYSEVDGIILPLLDQNQKTMEELRTLNPHIAGISEYLSRKCGYPVYKNTDIVYFPEARLGFEEQLNELKKAKKFIFLEYYAIEDTFSWQKVQEILELKAKEGIDVRVIYDDMGSIGFINTDFMRRLESKGIRCCVFNELAPWLNVFLNNRDHRKITVIDGITGFTGGYNMADEYFNIKKPYGYWKDTGIMIKGEAVKSLTAIFLEMWYCIRDDNTEIIKSFIDAPVSENSENGFIQPYGDNPMDDEETGENVYLGLADQAVKYIWYTTPYLILNDELIHALGLAAKKGVDVRIITPGIPDKKMVYSVTRSYYNSLARNGVKIYEFTPGFCHCKMCVTDDIAAVNGSINLDLRSFYHDFENACLYYGCKAVKDTKEDIEKILSESRDVTEQYRTGRSAMLRFGQMILRLFAPLM